VGLAFNLSVQESISSHNLIDSSHHVVSKIQMILMGHQIWLGLRLQENSNRLFNNLLDKFHRLANSLSVQESNSGLKYFLNNISNSLKSLLLLDHVASTQVILTGHQIWLGLGLQENSKCSRNDLLKFHRLAHSLSVQESNSGLTNDIFNHLKSPLSLHHVASKIKTEVVLMYPQTHLTS
jgi:hypothetical protein